MSKDLLRAVVLACTLSGSLVHCQTIEMFPDPLNKLNAPQRDAVEKRIEEHQCAGCELRISADRKSLYILDSALLEQAFPKYKFVVIRWTYGLSPDAKKPISVPGWTSSTLAIDEDGAINADFFSSGDGEQIGEFLRTQKVRARNPEEASLVATIVATIMRGLSLTTTTWPNIRHTPTEWYLSYHETPFRSISSYEETREAYYYDVRTDGDGFVISGKLRSDILERRKIPPDTLPQ